MLASPARVLVIPVIATGVLLASGCAAADDPSGGVEQSTVINEANPEQAPGVIDDSGQASGDVDDAVRESGPVDIVTDSDSGKSGASAVAPDAVDAPTVLASPQGAASAGEFGAAGGEPGDEINGGGPEDAAVRIATLALQVDRWWISQGRRGLAAVTAIDAAHLGAWMTDATRETWEAGLMSAMKPSEVVEQVSGLALLPWKVEGTWVRAPVRDVSVSQVVSAGAGQSPETGRDLVEVSFVLTAEAAYIAKDSGKLTIVPVTRRVVYVMEQADGLRSWLLRDWGASQPVLGPEREARASDGWFTAAGPLPTVAPSAVPSSSPSVVASPKPSKTTSEDRGARGAGADTKPRPETSD